MADAFECARCGSDRADPRRFSRHGSAIDEAYCDGCWPIVAGELSGSSSEIDPEKMKWIHEVMEGEEEGIHPGDSDGRVAALDNPPHMINMTGLDSDGVSRRLGTPDRMAALDMVEAIEEDPNLDPNDVMDERWKPTNFGTPLRSHKDTSPYFGGKRSPQAIEALGDKNIDFRASEDPFDYAWDMVVKMPENEEEDEYPDVPDENKGGDCYMCAGRHLWNNPEHTLVHAMVTGQGPIEGIRYGHAFTTFTDPETGIEMVHDPTAGVTWPAFMYYRMGQIREEEMRKYTMQEMNEKALESGHWGPWDEKTE